MSGRAEDETVALSTGYHQYHVEALTLDKRLAGLTIEFLIE
jgi:hypothetical protein